MTTTEAAAGEELNVEEKPRRRSHKNKTIAAVQQELAGGESASAPSTPTFERKRKGSCFCGTTAAESQLLANNGNVRKRSSSTRRAYKGSDVSEGTAGDSSGSGTGTGTPATGQTMPRKGASVSATPIKGGESCGKTLLCTGPLNDDWKKHKAWASLSGSGQHSEGPEGDKISARQRHEVEIVETEAEYVEKLTLIKELYETPLATLAKGNEKAMIITQAQVTHIFSNLDIILTYNGVLYKQMREWKDWKDNGGSSATPSSSSSTPAGATNSGSKCKCSGQAPRSLGAIFLTLTDFLKTYTGYCNNYPRALETLAELREKNKRFVEFLEKTQTHPKLGGMDINMLILMPIQRIPRYVLLLQELLKCTPEDDPDHSKLVLALEKMRAVADDLNKKKKDAEDREVLKSVAKRLVLTDSEPLLAVPSRRFVKEGEVVVLASFIEKGKAKNFYAFLFNDIFCLAKATIGGKFKAAEVFRIIDYTVDTTDLTTAPKGTLKKPLTPASAAIAFSSDTKSFLLTTEDPNALADWLDKIKDCKLQLQKSVQTFKDAELKLSKRST